MNIDLKKSKIELENKIKEFEKLIEKVNEIANTVETQGYDIDKQFRIYENEGIYDDEINKLANCLINNGSFINNNIVSAVIQSLTINSNITFNNVLNSQIFNSIQKSDVSSNLSINLTWQNINNTYSNNNIIVQINHQVNNGFRTESFNINTLISPIVIPNYKIQGNGFFTDASSLSINYLVNSNSVQFNSITTLSSNIHVHNMGLNILLPPQFIGNINLN